MRKNGSRLISLKQYKMTDLFVFAVILVAFDLIAHFAPLAMKGAADYIFLLTVPYWKEKYFTKAKKEVETDA